jgi:hypothetical protein
MSLLLYLLLLLRVGHIQQRSTAAAWALPCGNDSKLLLLLLLVVPLHPLHVCGEGVQRCLQLPRLLTLCCQSLLQGGSIWCCRRCCRCWAMLLRR